MAQRLSVVDHDRDSVNLTYVYPVVSRRAGGVSVGINLNPNNACNFRCIYCQVPDLVFGKGPELDLALLEHELRWMLSQILDGDFMARRVPEGSRHLKDIAFSGNGEPTSSPQFEEAVEVVAGVLNQQRELQSLKTVLITNGTLTDKPQVRSGLSKLAQLNGEIWFKLDSATAEGAALVNSSKASVPERIERLKRTALLCPTWIQSCWFKVDGRAPERAECERFVELMRQLASSRVPLRGVLLYGLARASMQPEAARLSALDAIWMQTFAEQIQRAGMPVRTSI